ncbi:MAG TPA: O-acetyl-ADP-ribose deacetylase [Spirochaetales bacterium]|nr:O-acetyl-ADP-ribose deacetylase [Spirochaetales bacterium]
MLKRLAELSGGRILVETGDITDFEGDAIVNAANSGLLGGGGVDGAIHRAAGPELLEACRKIRAERLPGGLPAGKAVLTGGYRLRARAVIHTVGPVYEGGGRGEAEVLASAYRSSLELASREGFKEIAFPAISTGVYGYPKAEAAAVALGVVSAFLASHALPEQVHLVFYGEGDARAFIDSVSP